MKQKTIKTIKEIFTWRNLGLLLVAIGLFKILVVIFLMPILTIILAAVITGESVEMIYSFMVGWAFAWLTFLVGVEILTICYLNKLWRKK